MFAPHLLSHREIGKGDDVALTSLEEGRGSHGIAGEVGSDVACAAGAVVGVDVAVWTVCGHWVDSDVAVWMVCGHWVDSDVVAWTTYS